MNKREARRLAWDSAFTVGDLRRRIAASPREGMSRVNPAFPMARALDIYAAALNGPSDAEPARRPRSEKLDVLLITNILRDTVAP